MPRKRASRAASRDAIIRAADTVVRRRGAGGLTVEAVAREAGCAKGLVHYHLKTKRELLEIVAAHLAESRTRAWTRAFGAADPTEVIDRTWELLADESENGTIRAWTSLFGPGGPITEPTARQAAAAFGRTLGAAADGMLRSMGHAPSIPPDEIGWLLAAVLNGMGELLASGVDRERLEGAYAAAWLGILSLAGQGQ